jgi:hypothetical protein
MAFGLLCVPNANKRPAGGELDQYEIHPYFQNIVRARTRLARGVRSHGTRRGATTAEYTGHILCIVFMASGPAVTS